MIKFLLGGKQFTVDITDFLNFRCIARVEHLSVPAPVLCKESITIVALWQYFGPICYFVSAFYCLIEIKDKQMTCFITVLRTRCSSVMYISMCEMFVLQ